MNLADKLTDVSIKIYNSKSARSLFTNTWYSLVTRLDKKAEATFLNYGYLYPDGHKISLESFDESDRYPIQLYHLVGSGVLLSGKEVLEVGCGRGGGANYIARYLKPKKMVGSDICEPAIEFDQKHYVNQNNLEFKVADAHNLPFADDSFDAVINVESSHHYADMAKFLREVYRVLRPGGHFLMAAIRTKEELPVMEQQLADSKMKLVKREEITSAVVAALDIDTPRRQKLISKISPKFLKRLTDEFAAVEGSGLYRKFAAREVLYFNYIYQRSN